MPEGLTKEVTDRMIQNGGGGGILADARSNIQFDSKFVSSSTVCIKLQFFGDRDEIAEVNYYPSYLMYGLKLKGAREPDWLYASFVPTWIFSSSLKARDIAGEKLMQPDLHDELLTSIKLRLQASFSHNITNWSYSAKKECAVIGLYEMTSLGSPNLTGSVQYFPSMGFYRWTFQKGRECNWRYVKWPAK